MKISVKDTFFYLGWPRMGSKSSDLEIRKE